MNKPTKEIPITDPSWPKTIQNHISEASPPELAFLVLFGSYGEKLVATRLLEALAKDKPAEPVIHAFPKGRWTV